MADIINFPLAAQKVRRTSKKPHVVMVDGPGNHLYVGAWEFTCQRCATKTRFEPTNMVFRTIDFFCASCGALHRVTNPAFAPIIKK